MGNNHPNRPIIGLSIDKRLIERIDSERGLIPRSRYVEELIKAGFENGTPANR